jgi:hypothetical protein
MGGGFRFARCPVVGDLFGFRDRLACWLSIRKARETSTTEMANVRLSNVGRRNRQP